MKSDSDTRTKREGELPLENAKARDAMQSFEHIRKFFHPVSIENALAPYQLASSTAHVRVLMKSGLLKEKDGERILSGLKQIKDELMGGKSFLNHNDPDIYTGLVRRLFELVGDLAQYIMLGRNASDALALDVRIWVRDSLMSAFRKLVPVRQVLLHLAEAHQDVLMPGYAHLQPTSPQFLSFFFMGSELRLTRDFDRMKELFERVNVLPRPLDDQMSSEAVVEHPFDNALLARLLKFDRVVETTFVTDSDYLLEFASLAAIVGVHLSQLASELLIWSTHEFGYVRLPRAFTFRNQRFPARRNPEILEALRSRSALFTGRLTELLSIMKGIPVGYSHEANEALPAVLDVATNLEFVLELSAAILPALTFDTKKMLNAAELDLENRGNVIDYLIEKEFTQEKATKIVDGLIEYTKQRRKQLADLAPAEWQEFSPAFDTDIYKYVSSRSASTKDVFPSRSLVEALIGARKSLDQDNQFLNCFSWDVFNQDLSED